ncbi:SMP-30/gluconolactonase/LRE family protein [Mycolicibacterium elephantis]
MTPTARLLSPSLPQGVLYEGPYFSRADGHLWWVDIPRSVVLRARLNGLVERFAGPERISAVVGTFGHAMLLTGERSLWVLDPRKSTFKRLLSLEDEPLQNRCNDAKCDPFGNLWFGTMDDSELQSSGKLWCLTVGGELLCFMEGIGISNTLAWDLTRHCMYFGDSKRGVIFVMDFRLSDGLPELGPAEQFVGPDLAPGVPDGSAIDVDGNLWNARWDGGCVVCINPNGEVVRILDVKARRPTSCAFYGPNQSILAVTTASVGLETQTMEPFDGNVLLLDVDATGDTVPFYKGSISTLSVTK